MTRFLPLLLAACAPSGPTYHDDVAPVLQARCAACHTEDGIGSMPLDSYADASQWGEVVADVMEARTMPPWLVRGDGTCGDFVDNEWVPDDQIALVRDWVDGGVREGKEAPIPEPSARPSLDGDVVDLQTPLFTPEIQGGLFAPNDEYRCFPLALDLDGPTFITGYEVVPGNDAIVHHVIGSVVRPTRQSWATRTNAEQMQRLHDQDGGDRDGWPCFEFAGSSVRFESLPITWAPGQGAVHLPAGTGIAVEPGDLLVAQVHFNLFDPERRGESDQTTIRLRYADGEVRPAVVAVEDDLVERAMRGDIVALAADTDEVSFTWTRSTEELARWVPGRALALDVWGVMPHMHELGVTHHAEVVRADGSRVCMSDVANWNFDWQRQYDYRTPIRLLPGDSVEVTCTWDTSGKDDVTLPGWGTQNEMCLYGMVLAEAE